LAQTIEALPPAELATTDAFSKLRPGLDGLAKLATDLRPAGRLLPSALRTLNATLSPGTVALRQLPLLTGPLRKTVTVLKTVTQVPSTIGALRKVGVLMRVTNHALEGLIPAQAYCNVIPLFAQGLASSFGSLGTGDGPAIGLGEITTSGSSTDQIQAAVPAPDAHINNFPNENASECESNNEPTKEKQDLKNPTGLQPNHTRKTSTPPGASELARSVGLLTPRSGQ
jgi:hypothetical protein